MGKKYSIADEGEDQIQSRPPGGDPDPDVEIEVDSGNGLDEREEQSDEDLFDDIVPSRLKGRQEPVEDESGDNDEDDDRPSKDDPFEKRLARERRLLNEVRKDNEELRAEMRHFREALVKKGAEEEFGKLKADADSKIADLKKKLTEAIEAGDTAEQVEITDKLADVKAELRAKESELKRAKEAESTAPETSRAQRAAKQWIRKHARYHTDPVFKAAAIALDKKLLSEGSDAADPEHFQKIDDELRTRFPEEYRRVPPRRQSPHAGDRPSTGDTDRKQGGFVRRGKKVIISARQAENMRRFGLDPEKPDDVKAYVRENS
jgi:hypothetical protein